MKKSKTTKSTVKIPSKPAIVNTVPELESMNEPVLTTPIVETKTNKPKYNFKIYYKGEQIPGASIKGSQPKQAAKKAIRSIINFKLFKDGYVTDLKDKKALKIARETHIDKYKNKPFKFCIVRKQQRAKDNESPNKKFVKKVFYEGSFNSIETDYNKYIILTKKDGKTGKMIPRTKVDPKNPKKRIPITEKDIADTLERDADGNVTAIIVRHYPFVLDKTGKKMFNSDGTPIRSTKPIEIKHSNESVVRKITYNEFKKLTDENNKKDECDKDDELIDIVIKKKKTVKKVIKKQQKKPIKKPVKKVAKKATKKTNANSN